MTENEPKIEKLFRAARLTPSVTPPKTFADKVMSQITRSSANYTIMVDLLFPKLAWALVFVIAAFLTSEVIMNTSGLPSLTTATNKLANIWKSELDHIITP